MKSKKQKLLTDPDALKAARELISRQRERLGRGDEVVIITGVPRRDRDPSDDLPKPEPRYPYFPPGIDKLAPQPKQAIEELPREWSYVFVQTRAPRGNDPGQIIEGQYG